MAEEIERKFLIDEDILDELNVTDKCLIEQRYHAVGKQEVRTRYKRSFDIDSNPEYSLTIKNGKGLVREEIECKIEEETFLQMKDNSKSIVKIRHKAFVDNHLIEIDQYILDLAGLHVAEIEFKSEEDANDFEMKSWMLKDVTDDPDFKNQSLWKRVNNIQ